MITSQSKESPFLVEFTNGTHQMDADVLPAKGGQGAGFGPHELLESSVACCINMWVRMQAEKLGIRVGTVSVNLELKRDDPQEATFEYSVNIEGALSKSQREMLLKAADDCPVRRTLSKRLLFARR